MDKLNENLSFAELDNLELELVSGGIAFIPLAYAVGKGALAGAGVASLALDVLDFFDVI